MSSAPDVPAPTEPSAPPVRSRATVAGIVMAIVLSILLAGYATALSALGLLSGVTDGSTCDIHNVCHGGELDAGWYLAIFGPATAAILGIIFAIIWCAMRRRFAWVFPVGGAIVATAIFGVGISLVDAALGSSFF